MRFELPLALRRGQGRLGGCVLLLLVAAATFGPKLAEAALGTHFDAQDLALGAQAPSVAHPFGTDLFGRDLLVRCLWGLQLSLGVGACAALMSVGIGTCYGALAGFVGGRADAWMMRAVDVLYALPFVFLVVVLSCVFGRSLPLLFVALGAVSWLSCARVVRARVQELRATGLLDALEVLGASRRRTLGVHVLPNAVGVAVAVFTLTVPQVVLEEAFLSFIGLGVQAPNASLGSLLGDGAAQMLLAWWQLLFPALTLASLLLALNLVGDALQGELDAPR